MEQQSPSWRSEFRSRRPHHKSRNGCFTCKQRRIKCDEKRPACTCCEDSLRMCVYATDQHSPGPSECVTAPRSSIPSPVPSVSRPFSSLSSGSRGPSPAPLTPIQTLNEAETPDITTNFTDADLYHHFLNHTCKYTPRWHKDRIVLQVGIAKLALDSEPVSHSILAQAAACLCWDMICKGNADPESVRQALNIGLQHYTLALEQMQMMTSHHRESEIQPLVANGLMLIPFAFAFQNIHHWVQSSEGSQTINFITPRDAVLLMRGIRITILELNSTKVDKSNKTRSSQFNTPWDTIFPSQATDSKHLEITPGRSHTMFPVLAATFHQALSHLQRRMESPLATSQREENITSIFDAYDLLSDIMLGTFSISKGSEDSLKHATHFSIAPDSLLAQIPSWLQGYVLRDPQQSQTEPLVRSFLTFFSCASEAYVHLLLPLFDPRPDDVATDPKPTAVELLALDLYAHWLVLMFLVENEAWWVGDFPVVALQGLIARYGDEILDTSSSQEQWWPAYMLEIMIRWKKRK